MGRMGLESMRFEPMPFESMPVESTPVESTPVESTPVESMRIPADATPAHAAAAARGRRRSVNARPDTALRPCRRAGRDGAAGPVQCTGSGSSSNIWVSIQA